MYSLYILLHLDFVKFNLLEKSAQKIKRLSFWALFEKSAIKTDKILFELRSLIDSGLDKTPLPEQYYDEKIMPEESGNFMKLTIKWYWIIN